MERVRYGIAATLLACTVTTTTLVATARVALAATQVDIVGPAGSERFGDSILVLSNGNFVVVDPAFDNASACTTAERTSSSARSPAPPQVT